MGGNVASTARRARYARARRVALVMSGRSKMSEPLCITGIVATTMQFHHLTQRLVFEVVRLGWEILSSGLMEQNC